MKFATFTVLLTGTLAACLAAAAPAQLPHEHAAHALDKQATVPATRWATDEPLRTGMSAIRISLDELRTS